MPGKISFHFDDGHASHFRDVYRIFTKHGVPACLSIIARPERGLDDARRMHEAGFEILCHSRSHIKMSAPLPSGEAYREIVESKRILAEYGIPTRQFITPMSAAHPSLLPLLREHYDAAFTRYTNAQEVPIDQLMIARPIDRYTLHRACLTKKSDSELYAYADRVAETDGWLVFYDHDLGVNGNITAERLDALVAYILKRGVRIVTSSQAIDEECFGR